MKKSLLALLVASAATTVSAGEIYSTDTSVVKLKGEVDAYLSKTEVDNGTTKTQTDPDVNVWAKIQLDAEHNISDSLTGFASFEIESGSGYNETNNNAKFDDVHVGVKTDVWGFAVGEVGDVADSMDAIQKDDITNEGEYMGSTGGHRAESTGHGAVFKAKVTDGLVFVADINTESDEDIDNTAGASFDWAINDMFSVGASYVSGEQAKDTDYSVMGVSASVDVEGFYFAATYGAFEGNNSWGLFDDSAAYYDGDAYGVAAAYTIEKTRLYTTYAVMSLDEATVSGADANGDTSNWVLGVDYALLDNVTIFGEYQTAETSNDFSAGADQDADTVVLGAYYTF
ncbi:MULTISPECIES: porin [Vibrio]|uniref:porin n=1 Tax=Vibrio TaxID=662 RepID=UPI002075A449|nr:MULTISPECIES: porin [Vibrio]USD33447.1 porin [Vibrio sp. SCSIO 43186]USD46516.1 porin [Vibrio sp. SCSIO 43145]USD70571.1 porin [Vibrio sp. SCSIO 43139]USD95493.1 porin [Vibrio coralliilyticus]